MCPKTKKLDGLCGQGMTTCAFRSIEASDEVSVVLKNSGCYLCVCPQKTHGEFVHTSRVLGFVALRSPLAVLLPYLR